MLLIWLVIVGCIADDHHQWESFKNFVARDGGLIHPNLTIAHSPGKGFGLFCRGHISSSDYALAVPSISMIYPDMVLSLYPDWQFLALSPEELVSLFIAVERFHGHSFRRRRTLWQWLKNDISSWSPYLAMLPSYVANAAHWTEDDMRMAQKMFTKKDAPNALRTAKVPYRDHLQYSGFTLYIPVTAAQYRWAYSVVMSRSFEGGYMVPYLDFANKGKGATLRVVKTAKDMAAAINKGHLVWRTTECNDEEIFLDYGDKSPIQLEAAFGFSTPENLVVLVPKLTNSSDSCELSQGNPNQCQPESCMALLNARIKVSWRLTWGHVRDLLWKCVKHAW